MFLYLFSLSAEEENISSFGFLARKKRETKKVKKKVCLVFSFSLRANFFSSDDEKRAQRKKKSKREKSFCEDRSNNNNVSQKKPIISPFLLFLKTHRKRRSGLISRARLFWTPSGEEVHRVERKERRDLGERESASEEI